MFFNFCMIMWYGKASHYFPCYLNCLFLHIWLECPLNIRYGATKCGLRQLSASLLQECKGTRVGIHTASPGMVLTELLLRYIILCILCGANLMEMILWRWKWIIFDALCDLSCCFLAFSILNEEILIVVQRRLPSKQASIQYNLWAARDRSPSVGARLEDCERHWQSR